jgi:hypothetical protein
MTSNGGHGQQFERYTPAYIFQGLGVRFALDPCAPAEHCPSKDWCYRFYSRELGQDGLELPWRGRVWLNPPFARGQMGRWLSKLHEHGNGIALAYVYTDTRWFVDNRPDALFFPFPRVRYLGPGGEGQGRTVSGGMATMLMAYGTECAEILEAARLEGTFAWVS